MLAIVVNFEILPNTETQAIDALNANAAGSRTEPGCLKWEWSRHTEKLDHFAIYELYVDRAAIDAHKASAHYKDWQSRTKAFFKTKTSGVFDVTGPDPRPLPK